MLLAASSGHLIITEHHVPIDLAIDSAANARRMHLDKSFSPNLRTSQFLDHRPWSAFHSFHSIPPRSLLGRLIIIGNQTNPLLATLALNVAVAETSDRVSEGLSGSPRVNRTTSRPTTSLHTYLCNTIIYNSYRLAPSSCPPSSSSYPSSDQLLGSQLLVQDQLRPRRANYFIHRCVLISVIIIMW